MLFDVNRKTHISISSNLSNKRKGAFCNLHHLILAPFGSILPTFCPLSLTNLCKSKERQMPK
jgi:hypothetical protein